MCCELVNADGPSIEIDCCSEAQKDTVRSMEQPLIPVAHIRAASRVRWICPMLLIALPGEDCSGEQPYGTTKDTT